MTIVLNQNTSVSVITDNATSSMGDTSAVVFSSQISSGTLYLIATIPNNNFKFTFIKNTLDDCCPVTSQQLITEVGDLIITESGNNLYTD